MRAAGSAKRSSARATGNRGVALRILRALAVSRSSGGTGASAGRSVRGRVAVVSAAVVALSLSVALPASATKFLDFTLGTGSKGFATGQFDDQNGVAANDSSIPTLTNETQLVTVDATAGNFTLTFGADTTASIAFNASPAAVQTALEDDISGIDPGEVSVVGGPGGAGAASPYIVSFDGGDLAGTNVDQLAATDVDLSGGGDAVTTMTRGVQGGTDVDGFVYVGDEDAQRVQVFDADGDFRFMWGKNVSLSDPGTGYEICLSTDTCNEASRASSWTAPEAGELDEVQAVAIDQSDGSVYVGEDDNGRISKFDAAGNFQLMIGRSVNQDGLAADGVTAQPNVCESGDTAGGGCKIGVADGTESSFSLNFIGSMTVDPNGDELFVADDDNARIQVFGTDGSFLRMYGWGVDPVNLGDGPEVCTAGCSGGIVGSALGQFDEPVDVALDDAGRVYVVDDDNKNVVRFDSGDTFANPVEFAAAQIGGAGFAADPGWIAIDVGSAGGTNDDRFYVVRDDDSAGETRILELDLAGNLLDSHAPGVDLSDPGTGGGLDIDPGLGRIYLSDDGEAFVYAFDDDGVEGIDIDLQPATNVQATTADLHADVDPNGPTGFPVSYHFEVSKDGISWQPVTDHVLVPPDGESPDPVTVQAEATGLEPNTGYRIRLVADRPGGTGSITSSELFFITDPAPPVAETIAASRIADTTAQLNGQVNPGGLATSYWFEWGDTAYGNQTPIPAASAGADGTLKTVGETITDLNPESVYHYRLCAHNALSPTPVCGTDQTFTTGQAVAASPGRSYEMVTAPDKPLRQGHAGQGGADVPDFGRANTALPATDATGETVRWGLFPGATSTEAGHGFTWATTYEVYGRTAESWRAEALTTVAPVAGGTNAVLNRTGGISADLGTSAWYTTTPMFSSGANQALRVMGDSGGPRGAGWYPWLDAAWFSGSLVAVNQWDSRIDDSGQRLVGAPGNTIANAQFHDVTPADGGAAPEDLTPAQAAGGALFLSWPEVAWRPGDLINECTGAVADGDQTVLPARVGTGVVTDTIGVRNCEAGSPTEVRGASRNGHGHLDGSSVTSMASTGDRFFFMSPDPQVPDPDDSGGPLPSGRGPCYVTVGSDTQCPPQVFVRQYDDQGNAIVRWLSRAEDALFDAPQEIGLFGHGASFEGASRDGSVVYFRTDAPLTTDDPNGGAQLPGGHVTGSASPNSWDLYRYELGSNDDADPSPPGADPGDRLTRISGGPSGTADPNTNCTVEATSGPQAGNCWGSALSTAPTDVVPYNPNGEGGAVRFMSDDGKRAYFVTTARIPDAANDAPAGGATTTPTADDEQVNTASRNLYLYDANKTGAAAYEFVARLPFSASTGQSGSIDSCASFGPDNRGPLFLAEGSNSDLALMTTSASCMHGTSSGDAVVFQTTGRLTADDVDDAADIYLYQAGSDRLTRVSAPPPGSSPYVCQRRTPSSPVLARCNADLGTTSSTGVSAGGDEVGEAGLRHWNVAENPDGTLKAVYFESRLALTPDDVNGPGAVDDTGGEGYMDVYEWRDGVVGLVSPGDSPDSAFYSGNSRDGKHVFFWTEQRISAWEIDGADGDLYSAAVGSGFPDPPPPPSVCAALADACQGGGATAGTVAVATESSPPDGNARAGERTTLTVRSLGAKARRRAARTGRLALRVRTTTAGRISAVARGRLAGRNRILGRTRVRARSAGVVKVNLRLKPAVRRTLRRGRALRLSVRVSQSGARQRAIAVRLARGDRR